MAAASEQNTGLAMNKRTTIILVAIVVLVGALIAGLLYVRQSQSPINNAQVPAPSCPLDAFRCSWDTEAGVDYTCTIYEISDAGKTEVAKPQIKTDAAGKALCTFTPQANKKYECTVTATREAGCTASDSAQSTCLAVAPSETPTPTPTDTPTPTPTPNPACYDTKCTGPNDTSSCAAMPGHSCVDTQEGTGTDYRCVLNTQCVDAPTGNPKACWCFAPTPTPTNTPTPTPTPTNTPTPTPTPTGTLTPTPTGTLTPTPTNTPAPTATSVPGSSPTPTDIVVVHTTGTPTTGVTNIAQATSPTPTSVPTLPVAGGIPPLTTLFLVIGVMAIGVALAL